MSQSTAQQEADSASGFALVAVLWFLVIVSAVVAPFVVLARTDFLIAANASQTLRLSMMAENLSTLISLELTDHQQGANFRANVPLDSTHVSCSVENYEIEFWLQDQAGLIDLNNADDKLLGIGLKSIGIPDTDAVAATISVFRSYAPQSAGTISTTNDAIVGGSKAGPFETVIELSDIQALRNIEPAAFHRAFTVNTGQSEVAKNRAPEPLARLLPSAAVVRQTDADATQVLAFSVEVIVREKTSSIRGYSGFIMKAAEPPNAPFKRLEQLFEPGTGVENDKPASKCPGSLTSSFAQTLADGR